jgi:hypothetical protein
MYDMDPIANAVKRIVNHLRRELDSLHGITKKDPKSAPKGCNINAKGISVREIIMFHLVHPC